MNHIMFMSGRAVCQNVRLLGEEVVVVDYTEELCIDCMSAIMAYNDRISQYELALSMPKTPVKVPKDPLDPAKAVMLGLLLSTIFWLTFALGVWLLWFR